jgi:hypothetical protein
MVMMMEVDVMLATRHRLGRDRFCAVRGRLRIAGRLLYAACCRLSLRRCSR